MNQQQMTPQDYQTMRPVNEVPTIGNYIAVQLLAMIPLVGFILMIVWAIGGNNTPIWKSNYARAYFVMMAILIGISIVIGIAFGAVIAGLLGGLGGSSYYW